MSDFVQDTKRLLVLQTMQCLGVKFSVNSTGGVRLAPKVVESVKKALAALDENFGIVSSDEDVFVPVVVHPLEQANVLKPGTVSQFAITDQGVVPEVWRGNMWGAEHLLPGVGTWSALPGRVAFTPDVNADTKKPLAPLRYRYSLDGGKIYVEGVINAGWAS